MELDEAIKHCRDKAEELRTEAEQLRDIGEVISNPRQPYNEPVKNCLECAKEHEQLAEWLEELKEWNIRKDMSKNGRCSIIVQGVPLFLTQGHIEALIKYDEEQTAKEALDRIFENIDKFRRKDNDSI